MKCVRGNPSLSLVERLPASTNELAVISKKSIRETLGLGEFGMKFLIKLSTICKNVFLLGFYESVHT